MKKQFIIYLLLGLAAGIAPFLIISPSANATNLANDVALFYVLPIFILQAGALWYFLSSLKSFQRGLRIAYYFLAAGLSLFALGQMQLPLTLIFQNSGVATVLIQVLVFVPYCFGTFMLYFALRKFAKLLQVKFLWTSFWFALATAIVVVALSTFLPHVSVPDIPESQWDLILGLGAWAAAFSAAAAIIAWRVRGLISASYRPATFWLALGLSILAFGYFHVVIGQNLLPLYAPSVDNFYADYSLYLLPFLLASIGFLRAGQRFKLVGTQYGALPEQANTLDVVVYTAELASSPRAIEQILNPVRELTATRQAGVALTPEEETQLKDVYLKLENYLLTEEPLRKFDRAELRTRLPLTFQKALT